ncbi:toll/interleukin-1 receptor domain-containing protein [Cyanobacteria bacterium FACHB-63]|nr:toll/interleukin-1 receptor domain-containing protein [Cyanobacteria bacterium FACHB-63]
MSDVFISYSRKDKEFVQALHAALEAEERDIWIDWEDIPATADWWQEIEQGIEGASTFVFVISPDSMVSEVCNREIDHAVKHHKRLVPIVRREGGEIAKTHPLSRHNWLFFRQEDAFDRGFAALMTAIEIDLEYVRSHTRLLERSIEWDKKDRNESFVLRGDDLKDAEAWLMQGERKEPRPTELQREYIGASQTAEEKAQILFVAGQKAKRMVQVGSGVLALTLIGAVATGWWAAFRLKEAEAGTQIERAGSLALRTLEVQQAEGLLLAMRAGFDLKQWVKNKPLEKYPAVSPILTLQTGLDNIQETRLN